MGLLGTPIDKRKDAYPALRSAVEYRVSNSTRESLIKTVTEIKAAMWSIKRDKAPGPNGYNFSNFRKNWDIVGPLSPRSLGM